MTVLALFEKFPPLIFNGKKVVWDTRQPVSAEPELILWEKKTKKELLMALIERAKKNGKSDSLFIPEGVSSFLAKLAVDRWGADAEKLKILGVTGTNGKSTCVSIIRHLLTKNKQSVCQIGTLGISLWKAGGDFPYHNEETGFTTPEAHQLYYIFHRLLNEGIECVAMEVSSHALELGRIHKLKFDGALFTNLTQDHLDFHKTMADYEKAKLKIFTEHRMGSGSSVAVVNNQDDAGKRILKKLAKLNLKAVAVNRPKNYRIQKMTDKGLEIELTGGDLFESSMVGDFNAENLITSLELVYGVFKIPRKRLCENLASFTGVAGRLERVTPIDYKFQVFVDYAHTPDALEKVLLSLNAVKAKAAKIYCVFGCGGDRDSAKRPLMGAIALKNSDHVVVTSDNPRSEDPLKIIGDIFPGKKIKNLDVEVDRRKAVALALSKMHKDDILVIAGKGHEQYQILGTQHLAFSDQQVVRETLELP